MALSFTQWQGTGTQESFPISFAYLDKSHVEVRVNLEVTPFTWDDPHTIRIQPAPAAGAIIEARRKTPRDQRLVDFVDGSVLGETDLDLSALQVFYIVQEAIDIAGGTLELLADGSYSAGNRRITNVAEPREARDAINRGWAETAMTSTLGQARAASTAAIESAARSATSATEAKHHAEAATTSRTASEEAAQQSRTSSEQARTAQAAAEKAAEDTGAAAILISNGPVSSVNERSGPVKLSEADIPGLTDKLNARALKTDLDQQIIATKEAANAAFLKAGRNINPEVVTQNLELVDHDNKGGSFKLVRYNNRLRLRNEQHVDLVIFQTDGNIFGSAWEGGHLAQHVANYADRARNAAQGWTSANCVQDIRQNGWWEMVLPQSGWTHCPNGGVTTALHMSPDVKSGRVSHFGGRYQQFLRNGQWITQGLW